MGDRRQVLPRRDAEGRHQPGAPHALGAEVFQSPADSIQERFGSPVDAMACGTPQLMSDWDGHRDTVEHRRAGSRVPAYWARYGDDLDPLGPLLEGNGLAGPSAPRAVGRRRPRRAAPLLRGAPQRPALRNRMGSESRRMAEARFGWPVVIRQYEAPWAALSEIARRSGPTSRWLKGRLSTGPSTSTPSPAALRPPRVRPRAPRSLNSPRACAAEPPSSGRHDASLVLAVTPDSHHPHGGGQSKGPIPR